MSANDVWAVGYYDDSNGNEDTLIEQWNGTSWTVVPSPSPGPSDTMISTGVAAVSANDVWAVGYYEDSNGYGTLIEQWNGSSWTVVPNPGSGFLAGVAAVSATDVWVVGSGNTGTLTEHWNGTSWSMVRSPNPGPRNSLIDNLESVVAVSATDVWATGVWGINEGEAEADYTLIEHWNGSSWTVVPNP